MQHGSRFQTLKDEAGTEHLHLPAEALAHAWRGRARILHHLSVASRSASSSSVASLSFATAA